jgi:hypothetical protein
MIKLADVNIIMTKRPHDWGRLSCCNESVTMRKVLITIILVKRAAALFHPLQLQLPLPKHDLHFTRSLQIVTGIAINQF